MKTIVIKKFECRAELNSYDDLDNPILMFTFYNEEGKYIGNLDTFETIVKEKKIFPETFEDNKVCSIGKSANGKWYGWSHRAIYGFSIGDIVKKGDYCASSGWTKEYLETHTDDKPLPIGFEAKTEEDCKRMAIAFASSVS